MKSTQIIFVFLLLVTTYGLHVKHHQSPESYLAALKLNQNGISSQLLSLKNDISQVQDQVNSQSDTAKKIILLQQAILRQQGKLSSLSKSLVIPLNDTTSECKFLLKTSSSELQSIASNVVTSTNSLNQLTSKISNQTYSPLFNQDSSAALAFSKELQKSLYSTSASSQNLAVAKQTNWLAPNWISGNKTPAQVQGMVKANDQLSGFLITCPLTTPFYDGTNCINCSNSQYFNYQTKKCVICNNFDITTRKCNDVAPQVKAIISNFESGLGRMILDPSTNSQDLKNSNGTPCPSVTPFLTLNGCINCQAPNTLFDYSKQVCTTCPASQTYIPAKYACIQSIKSLRVTNLPAGSSNMILPDGTTIDTLQAQQVQQAKTATLNVCPANQPFFNNIDCISCPTGQYFVQSKLSCQACLTGQKYNQTVHQCVKTTFYTNLLNRNWTSTNPDGIRNKVKTASSTPGSSPCPIEQAFYDGSTCRSCPANQQFNFDGSTCEVCSTGLIFSQNLHSCVKYEPNAYQTNPQTAPNLIYDGTSISQYMQQYQNNISQYPHMIDCSAKDSTRPYFDGISCISCPPEFPNFNLKQRVCQICSQGTYDAKEHECMSSNSQIISQKPNIQKILASIFT